MKDFTISVFKNLLKLLNEHPDHFQTFGGFIAKPESKVIILRHDVDKLPGNALRFAQIEHGLGIHGTYYFRIVSQSFDPVIIEKIAALGHEIGYHYEDIDLAYQQLKNSKPVTPPVSHSEAKADNPEQISDLAIEFFKEHLSQLRKYYPIQTICMHGSPLSKFDNKLLWKYYDYKDFGIIGEPYFDVNFEDMFYLTDTGRRWDGDKYSIRDKPRKSSFAKATEDKGRKAEGVVSFKDWVVKPKVGSLMRMTEKGIEFQSRYNFRSTNKIIRATKMGKLPDKMMMTFHPQRWTDRPGFWVRELLWQNTKNVVKYFLVRIRE